MRLRTFRELYSVNHAILSGYYRAGRKKSCCTPESCEGMSVFFMPEAGFSAPHLQLGQHVMQGHSGVGRRLLITGGPLTY
jgi:hypothetical protein